MEPGSTDRGAPSGIQMLALSLPTWAFAGYDLARRTFLAAYLSYDLGLPIATVGRLVLVAGLAAIPAEMIAGALCDRGSARIGARVAWMLVGTVLLAAGGGALLCLTRASPLPLVALALIGLVVGWAICNVTHGAWALEATRDDAGRTRVFGLRSLAGIIGGISFSLIGALHHGHASPFVAILLIVSIGAPLAHLGLVALVPDRAPPVATWRPDTLWEPVRLLFVNRGNRRLAALFALNGAHTAITGTAYLYLVDAALALPGWGPTGVLVQSVCAAIGIAAAMAIGPRLRAIRTFQAVCWINGVLALVLVVLPAGRPAALIVWSALFGLVSAVDFMALRVLLGERLDHATRTGDATAPAAAHYAGFHLPFNLCGALATGLLFAGYRLLGFDPSLRHGLDQAYGPAQLLPALGAMLLMAASLWLARCRDTRPHHVRHGCTGRSATEIAQAEQA
ncbi:MFS transporter [Sphingomonas melonis]|uniref:Na+/melibiose symporter-like transporter n=1 Tax=Sphingomonas melonis TaxID=152682 RepID=A0A7Y9FPV5_9SPHN|nr:Na+/melibiose symporter-like transporter [Sphingomonas melonis]